MLTFRPRRTPFTKQLTRPKGKEREGDKRRERERERERGLEPRALPESELNLTDCQLSQSLPIINFRFCCMFYVGKAAGKRSRKRGKQTVLSVSESVSE